MVATGLTWFLGNFGSGLLYLYRGPLVQCVLSYPEGRLSSRLERGATVIAYAAAVTWPVGESELGTIALAALLVGAELYGYFGAVGRDRRARVAGVRAALAVGAALAGGAAARLAFPAGGANELALLAYEATLTTVAVVLMLGLLKAPWEHPAVTDLVVELGETRSATLRDALAQALGDPSLEVGYWVTQTGSYVDAEGGAVALPGPGAVRSITAIEREGEPVAILVHDPAVLGDPSLVDSIAAATRLTASNARLQAEVRTQIAELQASRRRLVSADDEERRRLEERLRQGAERRLAALAVELGRIRAHADEGPRALEMIAKAESQLERTLNELHELAGGLHPRLLAAAGLPGALEDLVERSPVPVTLSVDCGAQMPPELEAAAYFVCSEGLANITKYASANRVSIAVANREDRLTIEVSDDGVGGADPARGSGLRGLADRVEALGGALRVDSPRGRGTLLSAEVPLRDVV